jgi:hypothetical protein
LAGNSHAVGVNVTKQVKVEQLTVLHMIFKKLPLLGFEVLILSAVHYVGVM